MGPVSWALKMYYSRTSGWNCSILKLRWGRYWDELGHFLALISFLGVHWDHNVSVIHAPHFYRFHLEFFLYGLIAVFVSSLILRYVTLLCCFPLSAYLPVLPLARVLSQHRSIVHCSLYLLPVPGLIVIQNCRNTAIAYPTLVGA